MHIWQLEMAPQSDAMAQQSKTMPNKHPEATEIVRYSNQPAQHRCPCNLPEPRQCSVPEIDRKTLLLFIHDKNTKGKQ